MGQLSGMTGFARRDGAQGGVRWTFEAKSVNGRGLDVRVALPSGFETLERVVRTAASNRFQRGSVQVGLRLETVGDSAGVTVNEAALDTLLAAWSVRTGADAVDPGVLAQFLLSRPVLEAGQGSGLRDLAADETVMAALTVEAGAVLDGLAASRHEEGRALAVVLAGLIDEIAALRVEAARLAEAQPELVRDRLGKQLDALGARATVDDERLAAELAIAAAKADVREELDRIVGHVDSARDLIAGGSPVGRRLDFLAQEFAREANTLCSKSASLDLTRAGLALKAAVDQFKEQAANVE